GPVSAQLCETVRHCSITGENDPPAPAIAGLQQIAVVTAIVVMPLARAPVLHSEGGNIDLAGGSLESLSFAPIELGNVTEMRSLQYIARGASADDARVFIKTTECSQLEMIKMRMRKKDKIDHWQLMKLERRRGHTSRTD